MNIDMKNIFKRIGYVLLVQMAIYLFLFIALPNIGFIQSYDLVWISCALIGTCAICFFGIRYLVPSIGYWILGIPFLWQLIMLYHPTEIYGISEPSIGLDFTSASMDAFIFSVMLFMLQGSMKILGRLVKRIRGRKVEL